MSNFDRINTIYDFDVEEMIETQIQIRSDYRVSQIVTKLAITTSLVLLFFCGFLGAIVLKDVGQSNINHVPVNQPN